MPAFSKQSFAMNMTLSVTLLTRFELPHAAFAWLLKYHVELPDGRIQRVEYYVSGDSGFVAKVSYEENTEAGKAAAAFWEPKNSPFVHKPGMLSVENSYQAPTALHCSFGCGSGKWRRFQENFGWLDQTLEVGGLERIWHKSAATKFQINQAHNLTKK